MHVEDINVLFMSGNNSAEFKNIMVEKYNDENKRRELSGDMVEYYWDSFYQPVFDTNAKIGYPKINKENYSNPETFGYVASVITCLGQSSRQF